MIDQNILDILDSEDIEYEMLEGLPLKGIFGNSLRILLPIESDQLKIDLKQFECIKDNIHDPISYANYIESAISGPWTILGKEMIEEFNESNKILKRIYTLTSLKVISIQETKYLDVKVLELEFGNSMSHSESFQRSFQTNYYDRLLDPVFGPVGPMGMPGPVGPMGMPGPIGMPVLVI